MAAFGTLAAPNPFSPQHYHHAGEHIVSKRLSAALATALLLSAGAAMAQDPSVPQRGQDSDPKLPPPSQQVPEKIRPDADASGGGATLSDKLEKSDGVLRPPGGVDPAIRTVPPETGSSMPVIKPPDNAK